MKYLNINKIYEELTEIKKLINYQNLELLDIEQTAEYLKLKKSYIYSLIHKKQIPYYKPNLTQVMCSFFWTMFSLRSSLGSSVIESRHQLGSSG